MVSVGVSRTGKTNVVFVEPGPRSTVNISDEKFFWLSFRAKYGNYKCTSGRCSRCSEHWIFSDTLLLDYERVSFLLWRQFSVNLLLT